MARSYHRTELERRFLLSEMPPDLRVTDFHWVVTDCYLDGQRLRLREMRASDGSEEARFKLGQKHRPPNAPAHERQMTTFNLTEQEYLHLRTLVCVDAPLVKHRYPYRWNNDDYSIDIFQGALDGLIVADLELDNLADLTGRPQPEWAESDVTESHTYEGASLARRAAGVSSDVLSP